METEYPYDFVAFEALKQLLQADVNMDVIVGSCREDPSTSTKTNSLHKNCLNEQQP